MDRAWSLTPYRIEFESFIEWTSRLISPAGILTTDAGQAPIVRNDAKAAIPPPHPATHSTAQYASIAVLAAVAAKRFKSLQWQGGYSGRI